jgi:Flp pilus assembly protein TadD
MPGNGGSVASNTDMEKPILNSKFGRRTLHLMVSTLFKGLAICILLLLPEGNATCASPRVVSRSDSTTLAQGAEPSVPDARMDAQASFAKGEAALKRGDLVGADAAFRRVIAADPHAGAAYSNLGVIAMRRQEWDRALSWLQKAEKLEPSVPGIRLNIGLVKYRRGDYPGAVAPLASVVRDQPDSFQARYLLGLCYVFTERYADAVTALERLWPRESNNFMYLYVLGIAAHNSGQKELDEKALARLVEVGGDAPEFHLILGKAYLNRHEPEKAIAELQRAESAKPGMPFLHFGLGIAYMRVNDNERAEAEFRKEIAVEPDLPDIYEQLGEFYLKAGKDEQAEMAFHAALHRNPKMPASLFGLAKINVRREKYPLALTQIDGAVRYAPDSQNVHFMRGRILMKLGRREEAQKEMLTAKRLLDASADKDKEPASMDDSRVRNPELAEPPQ